MNKAVGCTAGHHAASQECSCPLLHTPPALSPHITTIYQHVCCLCRPTRTAYAPQWVYFSDDAPVEILEEVQGQLLGAYQFIQVCLGWDRGLWWGGERRLPVTRGVGRHVHVTAAPV